MFQSILIPSLCSFCMLETVTTLLSSHAIKSNTNFATSTPKTQGKHSEPAKLYNTFVLNMALKWGECSPSLTLERVSSVFTWPMETTPNLLSPMFGLEMVTTSEDNYVCKGKMATIASFLLTYFSNIWIELTLAPWAIHGVLFLKWRSPPRLFSLALVIIIFFDLYYSFVFYVLFPFLI